MALERIHTYHIVRVFRMVVPLVVLALIGVLIVNYQNQSREEITAAPVTPKLVENVSELAEEIKFSREEAGRTAFTVEARSNLGFADGRNLLEDVIVSLYGEDGQTPERRIRSDSCGYDETTNDIRCEGNVEMQLDEHTTGRTAAMSYNHGTRTITALEETEVVRPDEFTGRADRMTLMVEQNILEIAGGVRITTTGGAVLEAGRARYYQKENRIEITGGLRLTTPAGTLEGVRAELELSPNTLDLRRMQVWEDIGVESLDPRNPLALTADELLVELLFGRVERALAQGRTVLEAGGETEHQTLFGDSLRASFDDAGYVRVIDAEGAGRMIFGPDQRLESQHIRSELAGVISTEEDSVLQVGDFRVEGSYFVVEQGEIIRFATDRPAVIKMESGHARGQRTEATFDPDSRVLLSLVQTGDAEFVQDDRTGAADRLEVYGDGESVLLDGNARVTDTALRIEASRIILNREDASFSAAGAVRTLWMDEGNPTLIVSVNADGNEERILFSGGAELWSGATYVKATTIEIEPGRRRFVASGGVRSTFDDVRFWSDELEFDEQAGIVHHSGNVRARSDEIQLDATDVRVTFDGDEPDRVVALGNVHVRGSDFDGRGDQAVYVQSIHTVTLTGPDAEISDVRRGAVRGCELVLDIETSDVRVNSEGDCRVVTRRILGQTTLSPD